MSTSVLRITFSFVFCIAVFGLVVLFRVVSAEDAYMPPQYQVDTAALPSIDVSAFLIFDLSDGTVLFEKEADTQLPIASVTKLATAARFIESGDLDELVTITWSDLAADGRAGKLGYGETYTGRELLFPLLLESSNDAAEALARADNELIARMNEYEGELGISGTTFADASGLSDHNVSTAKELMVLARHIYITEPHVFDVTRLREYYSEGNGWINNSPFIGDSDYRGGKHGFTYEANRTAIALFSETFNGVERILGYVILGSNDLRSDMNTLRSYVGAHTRYQ